VGRDKAVGGSATLTKEEKQKWKNRQQQNFSAKHSPGRKIGLGGRNGIARAAQRLAMDSYS